MLLALTNYFTYHIRQG